MFFKRSRFNLRDKYVIEFNDVAISEIQKSKDSRKPVAAQNTDALYRLLRDNIAQVTSDVDITPSRTSLSYV